MKIAELVYEKINSEKYPLEKVSNYYYLFNQIKQQVNFFKIKILIDCDEFVELFTNGSKNSEIKVDISLIPNYMKKDEFILWLAYLVEKITFDELRQNLFLKHSYEIEQRLIKENEKNQKITVNIDESSNNIIDYFSSKNNK